MSSDNNETNGGPAKEHSNAVHPVTVDGIDDKFEENIVKASELFLVAEEQVDDDAKLDALRGPNGPVDEKFDADEEVDLTEPHRRHFEIDVPPGGYI
ncbi:hypothetical protein [Halorubellus sp. PRR65]|jgi:hypothetical protein|uniref:hypothetical protein n=1 Tax=Halorubellus sp. PRR65 TaxID=3098148 RepID=UPI002B25B36E|nr:hypothetical protein [Halorubellus sp. PRR65]